MNKPTEVLISLCDPLNDGLGYQVRVTGREGAALLLTSRDPADGSDLLSLADALRVAGAYSDAPRPEEREFIPAGEYVPLETRFGKIMVLPIDGEHVNVEVREHDFLIDGVHFCFALTVLVGPGLAAVPVGRLTEWSSGGTLTPRRKDLLLQEVLNRVDAAAAGPMAPALKDAQRRVVHNDILSINRDVEQARQKLDDLIAVRVSLLDEEASLAAQ